MTSSRGPSGPNGSWSLVLNCELYLDDGVQANLATAYGPNIVGPRQGKSSSVVQVRIDRVKQIRPSQKVMAHRRGRFSRGPAAGNSSPRRDGSRTFGNSNELESRKPSVGRILNRRWLLTSFFRKGGEGGEVLT